MGTGGKVHGADDVARTMHALADDVAGLGADVGPDAGALAVRTAQGFAPRRTGRLRSTIQSATVADVTTVSAGAGITYAGVQEYGSKRRHIQPHYYMRRTVEQQETKIVNLYETAVTTAVDNVRGA